jgi:hypothetical protein
VAHERDPLESEGVEQREQVGGELLLVVARGRRRGPAEPAQVGAEHPEVLGERREDLAPLPPVLGPAVQQDERRGRGIAGLGDVDPQAAGLHVDVAVGHLDARDGQLGRDAHALSPRSGS